MGGMQLECSYSCLHGHVGMGRFDMFRTVYRGRGKRQL